MDEPSHETWPLLHLGGCFASGVVIARDVSPSQK